MGTLVFDEQVVRRVLAIELDDLALELGVFKAPPDNVNKVGEFGLHDAHRVVRELSCL